MTASALYARSRLFRLIFMALCWLPLAGCASGIEPPPLQAPLLNPAPKVAIVTLSGADIKKSWACRYAVGPEQTPWACTPCFPKGCEIIMPPYESMDGRDYSDLFFHELEGHALRGLCHIKDGRGWKPCR